MERESVARASNNVLVAELYRRGYDQATVAAAFESVRDSRANLIRREEMPNSGAAVPGCQESNPQVPCAPSDQQIVAADNQPGSQQTQDQPDHHMQMDQHMQMAYNDQPSP